MDCQPSSHNTQPTRDHSLMLLDTLPWTSHWLVHLIISMKDSTPDSEISTLSSQLLSCWPHSLVLWSLYHSIMSEQESWTNTLKWKEIDWTTEDISMYLFNKFAMNQTQDHFMQVSILTCSPLMFTLGLQLELPIHSLQAGKEKKVSWNGKFDREYKIQFSV